MEIRLVFFRGDLAVDRAHAFDFGLGLGNDRGGVHAGTLAGHHDGLGVGSELFQDVTYVYVQGGAPNRERVQLVNISTITH